MATDVGSYKVPVTDAGMRTLRPLIGDIAIHMIADLDREYAVVELERAVSELLVDLPALGCCYQERFWQDRRVALEPAHALEQVLQLQAAVSQEQLTLQTKDWICKRPLDFYGPPLRIVGWPVVERALENDMQTLGGTRRIRMRLLVTILHQVADGAGAMAVAACLAARLKGIGPTLPIEPGGSVLLALERVRWFHGPLLLWSLLMELLRPLRLLRISSQAPAKRTKQDAVWAAQTATGYNERDFNWTEIRLDTKQQAAFGSFCKQRAASINDGLVALLALVAARRVQGGDVAVAYTMDLRRYLARPRLLMANLSSIVFAMFAREQLLDRGQLVATVHKQTLALNRGFQGLALLLFLNLTIAWAPAAWMRSIGPWVGRYFMLPHADRALFLTNVGRVDSGLGALVHDIVDLELVGPCVGGIGVPFVTAYGFGGTLRLQVFADALVGAEGLAEFVALLRAELDKMSVESTE